MLSQDTMRHHLFGWVQCAGIVLDNTEMQTKRKRITLIVLRPTATFLEGAIVIVPPPVHSMNVFPLAVSLSFQFVNLSHLVIVSGGSDCNSASLHTLYDMNLHHEYFTLHA